MNLHRLVRPKWRGGLTLTVPDYILIEGTNRGREAATEIALEYARADSPRTHWQVRDAYRNDIGQMWIVSLGFE